MSVSPSSSARLTGAAAAILLASAPVFVHAAPGAVPPVVVAVQASGSGAIERSFISASVDHLTYALPDTPLVFRYLPLGEIQKLAESRRVDFVLAPPDGYVVLERFFGARSLVSQTIRESSSADSVLGIVVAVNAAEAPDASASVLNGASILVPELDGMPARMLRRELMHAGVERAVPEALRTKTDDPEGAILEAVASGRADAGILPACYVERLSATDPKRLSGIRLAKIDSQSTKASDIIDHVRSFARQPAQPVPTSLSDLAEKAIAQFCATRGLEVSRRIEPGVTILADALEMELLISNLLKNAADATAGTDDAVIRASLSAEDGTAMLTISDNGPRLTDEQFARLTIPLNTSKPQGLGLGLVIVRRIAESARGRVLFERLPERGLAITVSLPVCEQNNRT